VRLPHGASRIDPEGFLATAIDPAPDRLLIIKIIDTFKLD
jgi:hypothetical protein